MKNLKGEGFFLSKSIRKFKKFINYCFNLNKYSISSKIR